MKRKALILPVIAAGAALLAAPSVQAMRAEREALACPSQTLGSIDVPVDGATVSGYVQVIGFALDGNLVSNVDVFVDGTDDVEPGRDGGRREHQPAAPGRDPVLPAVRRDRRRAPRLSRPPSRRPSFPTARTRCTCASRT